jgi:tetratricopeptide (TPR) repeat protein
MTSMTDARGDTVTGASARALDLFEQAVAQFQTYSGDPVATIDAALADSPDFGMAHAFRAWIHLLATETAAMPVARESVRRVEDTARTTRERGHAAALDLMLSGEMRHAVRVLDDVLLAYPRDALALQAAHLGDLFLGDARSLRDRIARVLPGWSPDVPGYHAVLGMYAFGLEENNAFARAEAFGREAIALNPRDAWAQHAVAHVMEMEGRVEDGIVWMRDRQDDWSQCALMAVHNWWHLALFHLDREDHDAVLALYDQQIRGTRSMIVVDMVDASALLWRLGLLGVDVGDRWRELADLWEPLAEDAHFAFNDLHAMMAFVGDGRQEAATALLKAQAARAGQPGDNGAVIAAVGRPLCRAFMAFGQEDYDTCIDILRAVRTTAGRFGGSNAQRDVIDLTLTEAALRSGHSALAAALAAERLAQKPESRLNLRLRGRSEQGVRLSAKGGAVDAIA